MSLNFSPQRRKGAEIAKKGEKQELSWILTFQVFPLRLCAFAVKAFKSFNRYGVTA